MPIQVILSIPAHTSQEANKPKLSPEEARKKAEEMIRQAKAKREKEEKEQEVRREKGQGPLEAQGQFRISRVKLCQSLKEEEEGGYI